MQIHNIKAINKSKRPKVYATLPVLNELENLPAFFRDIEAQNFQDWKLFVCVNQPDEWWKIPDKKHICEENAKAMVWIANKGDDRIELIDRSSSGLGWKGKRHGVGWARKTAMDLACSMADPDDLILSLDADTHYPNDYFKAVSDQIQRFPAAVGLSAPYYHRLTGDEITDRCMLRYEIYMRNFSLNMLKIRNPYCFSAIGSGMACPAKIYRKVGGLTPKLSGEDFYFIQKLRKSGKIIIDCDVVIHPAARFSNRVYFGTGPAMIKGRDGNWESYPIYSHESFAKVQHSYKAFDDLYYNDFEVPMQSFINLMDDGADFWATLRNNSASKEVFVKACTQRLDGLRILQFLKADNTNYTRSDEEKLKHLFNSGLFSADEIANIPEFTDFSTCSLGSLDALRNLMFQKERSIQKEIQLA